MGEDRLDMDTAVPEEKITETPAETPNKIQLELWHQEPDWEKDGKEPAAEVQAADPAPEEAVPPEPVSEPEPVPAEAVEAEETVPPAADAEDADEFEPEPDPAPEKKKHHAVFGKGRKEKPDVPVTPPARNWRFRTGFVVGFLAALVVCGLVTGIAAYVVRYDGGRILPNLGFRSAAEAAEPAVIGRKGSASFYTALEKKLAEIDRYVDSSFIFPVEDQKLLDGAVRGYVDGLEDIYSVYYTPEEYEATLSDSDGSYVGIGVVVQQDPKTNLVTALTVYPDSPAELGGMLKGDIITKVDGEDVTAWDLSDIVAKIRGEEGTDVLVTVYREGEYLDLPMVRAALDKITVETEMLEDGIGYLQLTEFDAVSVAQIETAVQKLAIQGMERLVLDLRDNPGGLLTSVVAIADDFLPKADVMYVEDKQENRVTYDSREGMIWDGPMVVLINGNSASASEVLSGALKDNERAVLVGEKTFGKGVVQSFFKLSDGSGVKLTTAHYFTPSGTDIHGVGITPDVESADDVLTEEDEQLQTAIEELKKIEQGN